MVTPKNSSDLPPNEYQSLWLIAPLPTLKLREICRTTPRGMLHQDPGTDVQFVSAFTTGELAAAFMQRRKLAVTEFTPAELGDPRILVMAMAYLLALGEKHIVIDEQAEHPIQLVPIFEIIARTIDSHWPKS
jgi:hypothetical protein